jgi:hypothetical protein
MTTGDNRQTFSAHVDTSRVLLIDGRGGLLAATQSCSRRTIRRGLPQSVLGNGRLWVVRRPLREGRYVTERLGRHGQRDGTGGRSVLSRTVTRRGRGLARRR